MFVCICVCRWEFIANLDLHCIVSWFATELWCTIDQAVKCCRNPWLHLWILQHLILLNVRRVSKTCIKSHRINFWLFFWWNGNDAVMWQKKDKPSLIYIRVNPGKLDIAVHIFQLLVEHSTSRHWDDTEMHGKSTLLRCILAMNFPSMNWQPIFQVKSLVHQYSTRIWVTNTYFFIDFNGFFVFFKLSCILSHFQHTFIGCTGRFFAFEVVSSLFIMLNSTCLKIIWWNGLKWDLSSNITVQNSYQIVCFAFIQFGNCLMMFSCHIKSSHIRINFNCFQ